MRIGMVLLSSFPPDIRVEKEVMTLAEEHEVFLLCPKRNGQPPTDTWKSMRIKRIFSTPERWWSNWRLMSTCFSRNWEKEINHYVNEYGLDVVHVHDLALLGTALKVGKRSNIPIVVDLHENYPQMLAQDKKTPIYKQLSPAKLVMRLAVSVERWSRYERVAAMQSNKIITVIEEAADRLIQLGLPSEKVHVVANYVEDPCIYHKELCEETKKSQHDKFRVVYVGGFNATRDLMTVINAATKIKQAEMPDLELLLVGGQGVELNLLRKHAARQAVQDRVTIHEWRPLEEIRYIIKSSSVGLVPHVKSPHTDSTIPHKLFQYMAERVPVIVSNCTPLERIVSESGCGLVYRSGDSNSFADCLRQLYMAPSLRERMGNAGYKAVREKFNWGIAGEELLRLYRRISQDSQIPQSSTNLGEGKNLLGTIIQ